MSDDHRAALREKPTIGLRFRDIVVGRERSGKPTLHFTGKAKARAEAMRVFQAEVTITHTDQMAAAVVALLCRTE